MARQRRDKGSGSICRDEARGGWRGEVRIEGKTYVRRGKTKAEVSSASAPAAAPARSHCRLRRPNLRFRAAPRRGSPSVAAVAYKTS